MFDRAINGELPFELKKQKSEMLTRCAFLNEELLTIVEQIKSQRAESVRLLLEMNKKELPDIESGEKVTVLRYENALIKIALELCCGLEKARQEGANVLYLLARSYSILSAVFSC